MHLGQLELSRGMTGISANTTSKFDITLTITEAVQGFTFAIEYCTDLYGEATISRIMAHFVALLQIGSAGTAAKHWIVAYAQPC